MATITDAIKNDMISKLNRYKMRIADTTAPPPSVTARSLLSKQVPVELLRHMKWLVDSDMIKPDEYASKNKRFSLMGLADDPNYSIHVRARSPEIADSKAYDLLCKFEISVKLSRIYPEHPDWPALYKWRDEVNTQMIEHQELIDLTSSNLQLINTTGQLNRCLPVLVPFLPYTRERASRGAKVRSPMPRYLRGNEVELFRTNRDLGLMIAKGKLVANMTTHLWLYG